MSEFIKKATKYAVDKVADIPKPEASIEDVDLKNVAKSGITYLAKLGVLNPYSHSIPICEISFCLKTDNRVIASGNVPDPGSIEAKKTTMLEVPMLVPHDIVLTLVKDLWKDWDIDYELQIGLIVDLPVFGSFTIPLDTKGEIKLPTIGSIFGGGDDEEKEKE
ncbi:late embryogenesis abundant protein Lea14-A-like [Silene latifolia]|uniref:late embryogenesis abundant protein Lea14-A-like n=1 Tax=Silene latifolia TaxID=37657 RepID=UPI003D77229B